MVKLTIHIEMKINLKQLDICSIYNVFDSRIAIKFMLKEFKLLE